MPGPPPKRSTQRRRRNTPATPIDTVTVEPKTYGHPLTGRHSAAGKRFWEALRTSGQAQFYEASDWAAAELVVLAIDTFVKSPSAALLASINAAMTSLLVTEGDRRRAHLELERKPAGEDSEAADVSWITDARRRLRESS